MTYATIQTPDRALVQGDLIWTDGIKAEVSTGVRTWTGRLISAALIAVLLGGVANAQQSGPVGRATGTFANGQSPTAPRSEQVNRTGSPSQWTNTATDRGRTLGSMTPDARAKATAARNVAPDRN